MIFRRGIQQFFATISKAEMLVERSESKSEAEPASGWRQLAASYSSEHRRPGSPTFSLTRKFSFD